MLSRAAGSMTTRVVQYALEGVRYLRIAYPKLDVAGEKDKVRTPVQKTALTESTRQPVPPPVTVRKRVVRGAATPKLVSPKAPSSEFLQQPASPRLSQVLIIALPFQKPRAPRRLSSTLPRPPLHRSLWKVWMRSWIFLVSFVRCPFSLTCADIHMCSTCRHNLEYFGLPRRNMQQDPSPQNDS